MTKSNNFTSWYSEDDIRQTLTLLAQGHFNVLAQTQFEHEDLLTDNFRQAINNVVETRRTQLMPIHLHGNHWAGAVVRMQADYKIQIIYNDPLGEGSHKLVTAVQNVASQVVIIDLKLPQQINGNDCGPFTVDNLIRLASSGNNLDGLDRDGIIKLRILQTPSDGSAIEIRTKHADLLPRLVSGSSNSKQKTTEQFSEDSKYKSSNAFWNDIKNLLDLKRKISEFKTMVGDSAVDDGKRTEILAKIGELAASIYHKEIDKSAIRNRFSSNEQSKKNILYLDTLELLTHLPGEFANINYELLKNSLSVIVSDLDDISNNIDFVLHECSDRIKEVAQQKDDGTQILEKTSAVISKKPEEKESNPESLKNFISAFYLPKAIERMREIIAIGSAKFDWNDRIDRYYFARIFAILGELSRDILCFLSKEAEQRNFFQNLKKIRNNLKKLAHIKFFADGNKVLHIGENGEEVFFIEDIKKLDEVISSFDKLDTNLGELQKLFAKDKINNLDAIKLIYQKEMLHDLKILPEFREILEGKNPYEGKATGLIKIILDKKQKVDNQSASLDRELLKSQYLEDISGISEDLRIRLGLPETLDERKIKTFNTTDLLNPKKTKINDDEKKLVVSFLAKINKIKNTLLSENNLENSKEELAKAQEKYREFLKDKEEYSEELPDPENIDEMRKFSEKKNKSDDGDQGKDLKKIKKSNNYIFIKYCKDFEREAGRLKSITEVKPSNEEERRSHEFAVAHSIGIIGESIRYLFEIDDETNFLKEFATRALIDDLNETRIVRNKQVMHGIFNYDSAEVLRVATQNTISWRPDVEAIGLVRNFTEIISHEQDYLDKEAYKLGKSSDQILMRIRMFIGSAYLRLCNMKGAEDMLEQAKLIAKREGAVNEIIKINKCLAVVERKKGNNERALELTEESLGNIRERPEYKLQEAELLANKATLISEVGKNEEAKELYNNAMFQGSVLAAVSLAQILCEEGKYQAAIAIYKDQFLKIHKEGKKRPFEFVAILRGLWLAQNESGNFTNADKTFENYIKFYRSNIALFKEFCGQGYRNIESLILRDEASNFYQKGHYRKAINRLENALSIIDRNGFHVSSADISHIHLNIANSYKYLSSKFSVALDHSEVAKFRDLAISHYKQVTENHDQSDSINAAHANVGLAEIFAGMRKYRGIDGVVERKKKAHEIFKKHGDIGKSYIEVMDNAMRTVAANHNERSKLGGISAKDDYASFQGDLLNISNLIKSGNHKEGLTAIEDQIEKAQHLGIVNPNVMQLMYNKFICLCKLKKQKEALDQYREFDNMVKKHPDCADHAYHYHANRIFQSNFKSSIEKPANSAKYPSAEEPDKVQTSGVL
jgi:tetratricopeptide (TPR) repeat protein